MREKGAEIHKIGVLILCLSEIAYLAGDWLKLTETWSG